MIVCFYMYLWYPNSFAVSLNFPQVSPKGSHMISVSYNDKLCSCVGVGLKRTSSGLEGDVLEDT